MTRPSDPHDPSSAPASSPAPRSFDESPHDFDVERPQTFGDCLREGWGDHDLSGPCPWVRCAHHLAWGRAHGARHSSRPGSLSAIEIVEQTDLDAMPHTCALRAANETLNLAQIGELFGVSRERVRQIEAECLVRLAHPTRANALGRSDDDGHELSRPDLHDAEQDFDALEHSIRRASVASNDDNEPASACGRTLVGDERAARIVELRARGSRSSPVETSPRQQERSLLDEIL